MYACKEDYFFLLKSYESLSTINQHSQFNSDLANHAGLAVPKSWWLQMPFRIKHH